MSEALTTNWARTARGSGVLIALTELGLLVVPPHRTPDAGLLATAGGLIAMAGEVRKQKERQRRRRDDDGDDGFVP